MPKKQDPGSSIPTMPAVELKWTERTLNLAPNLLQVNKPPKKPKLVPSSDTNAVLLKEGYLQRSKLAWGLPSLRQLETPQQSPEWAELVEREKQIFVCQVKQLQPLSDERLLELEHVRAQEAELNARRATDTPSSKVMADQAHFICRLERRLGDAQKLAAERLSEITWLEGQVSALNDELQDMFDLKKRISELEEQLQLAERENEKLTAKISDLEMTSAKQRQELHKLNLILSLPASLLPTQVPSQQPLLMSSKPVGTSVITAGKHMLELCHHMQELEHCKRQLKHRYLQEEYTKYFPKRSNSGGLLNEKGLLFEQLDKNEAKLGRLELQVQEDLYRVENLGNHKDKENFQEKLEKKLGQIEYGISSIPAKLAKLEREKKVLEWESHLLRVEKQSSLCTIKPDGLLSFPLLDGKYQVLAVLGKGGFGEIYKAFDLNTSSLVAIKIPLLPIDPSLREKVLKLARRELEVDLTFIQIHRTLDHQNIVAVVGEFEFRHPNHSEAQPQVPAMVFELCEHDLRTQLTSTGPFSEQEALKLLASVLLALQHLSTLQVPVVHRDIKPENVLYKSGVAKISDFGLAVRCTKADNQAELSSFGGTPAYLAYEALRQPTDPEEHPWMVGPPVDMWSVGILGYELVSGKRLFDTKNKELGKLTQELICGDFRQQISAIKAISPGFQELLLGCLKHDPHQRLTAEQALHIIRNLAKIKA